MAARHSLERPAQSHGPSRTPSVLAEPPTPPPAADSGILPAYVGRTKDESSPSLTTSSSIDPEKYQPGDISETPIRKEKRKLGWRGTTWVLIASQISLGVLSLPTAVAQVGLLPGLVLMWFFQIVCTYTGYIILQYRQKHQNCDSFADLMAMWTGKVFGCRPAGRWAAEIMVTCYLLFLMAAHINVWRDTLYVLTGQEHSCRIVFGFIGMMVILLINLVFPLEESMPLSVVSCISIIAALFTAMISVGILNPGRGNWHWFLDASVPGITLAHSSMGVANIALSYVGHPMYPAIISGMKERKDFLKSLIAFEVVRAIFLTLVGCLFYVWGGQFIVSPALGAASPVVSKTAYGIAIPTIVMAGAIPAYIIAKGLNKQFWQLVGKPHRANMAGWTTREEVYAQLPIRVILIILWIFAFILAMSIPVFEEILGFMGALFATLFGLIIPSLFWLDMYRSKQLADMARRKRYMLLLVNILVPAVGVAVFCIGIYGSGTQIRLSSQHATPAFSCTIPDALRKTLERMKGP